MWSVLPVNGLFEGDQKAKLGDGRVVRDRLAAEAHVDWRPRAKHHTDLALEVGDGVGRLPPN